MGLGRYKIAVATSDGLNVDLHFGSAKRFDIYIVDDTDFLKIESREVPTSDDQTLPSTEEVGDGAGCGTNNGDGCNSGCGTGCGSKNGCDNGGKSEAVELLSDCRCVVCKKIGRNILKQFERKAISVFDIEMPIKEALDKIVTYYYKIDERKLKFRNQEE